MVFPRITRRISFATKYIMKRFPVLYLLVFLALRPKMAATLPSLLKSNLQIVRDRVANRKKLKNPDYFSSLLPEDRPLPPDNSVVAQANHLIVGGFNPDTNLFTTAVYYLLKNPNTYERFKGEIRRSLISWIRLTTTPCNYSHISMP